MRISWGKVRYGKEKEALALFADAVTYYGKKMADGKVTFFEPYLLSTADQTIEVGFFVVKAPVPEIFAILEEDDFKVLNTKAYLLLDHFKVDLLTVGEGLEQQLKRFEKAAIAYSK